MRVGNRNVGVGWPVFLQAEVGTAHMGEVSRALALVEAAKEAGMDAVKFIVTDPDQVECPQGDPYSYMTADGLRTRPIADLTRETTFTLTQWRQIADHCRTLDIVFYATVDHIGAVLLMETLEVPAYKICAWDIGYQDLFAAVGATGKPLFMDIGTATLTEIADAMKATNRVRHIHAGINSPWPPWALGTPAQIVWLHSPHPHGGNDWALNRIAYGGTSGWGIAWGFSSPGREDWCDYVALGRGAVALEKRITLNRAELRGHHHWIALEPSELKQWASGIRLAERALHEYPWDGSPEAWADRRRYDRTLHMPDGRMLRAGTTDKGEDR